MEWSFRVIDHLALTPSKVVRLNLFFVEVNSARFLTLQSLLLNLYLPLLGIFLIEQVLISVEEVCDRDAASLIGRHCSHLIGV